MLQYYHQQNPSDIVFKSEQTGPNLKMVEKIREPYQKHARNISTVSDISTTGSTAEPLKRDENAEIRCVLLCDSETERNAVEVVFDRSIKVNKFSCKKDFTKSMIQELSRYHKILCSVSKMKFFVRFLIRCHNKSCKIM